MSSGTASRFSGHPSRRKTLVALAGLLAVILIVNGVISLFALYYSNDRHLEDLQTLKQIMQSLETARTAQVHFKKQVQEWKNTLLRGSDPKDLASYQAAFAEEERQMDQGLSELADLAQKLQMSIPEIEQVRKSHETLGVQYRAALQDYHPQDSSSAMAVDRKVRGIDRAPTDQMDEIVNQIQIHEREVARLITDQNASRYGTLRSVSIGSTAAGVIIVLISLGVSFMSLPRE